jgi:hypothetical protein
MLSWDELYAQGGIETNMDPFMAGGWGGGGSGFDFDPWGGITIGGTGTGGGVYIPVGGGGTARERAVQLVNASEYTLQQNLVDLDQGRISRTEAIHAFDVEWQRLTALLNELGAEGARAIADRTRGGKFDWFRAYRPQESGTGAGTGNIFTGGTGAGGLRISTVPQNQWFLLLAVALVGYLLWKK